MPEKQAWRDSRAETGGGTSISAFADGSGSLQFSVSLGRSSEDEQDLDSYSWPDELPPFYGSHIPIDSPLCSPGRETGPDLARLDAAENFKPVHRSSAVHRWATIFDDRNG